MFLTIRWYFLFQRWILFESCVINRVGKQPFSRSCLGLNVLKNRLQNGQIVFFDQSDLLKEDILQVQYLDDLLLDVGFYGKQYKIFVKKNLNLGEPIVVSTAADFNAMLRQLQKVIPYIKNLQR